MSLHKGEAWKPDEFDGTTSRYFRHWTLDSFRRESLRTILEATEEKVGEKEFVIVFFTP